MAESTAAADETVIEKTANSASDSLELTEDQQNALEEFRVKAEEYKKEASESVQKEMSSWRADDISYMKFLVGNDWVVDGAFQMYSDYIVWRVKNKVSLYPEEKPPQFQLANRLFTDAIHGVTKGGQPLYIQDIGHIHMPVVEKTIAKETVANKTIWQQENILKRCRDQTKKLGKPIISMIAIIDLAGLNKSHMAVIPWFGMLMDIYQNYYPGVMQKVFVVNAPYIFPMLWKIAKGMIDPETREKIEILSAGEMQERLLEFVDADQLPEKFGGTCTCKDNPKNPPYNMCVPENEWKLVSKENDLNIAEKKKSANLIKLHIPAKGIEEIVKEVPEFGGEIGWFYNSPNDVNFSVMFHPTNGEPVQILTIRASAHDGFYEMRKGGTVKFKFDNSTSRVRSKNVKYEINMAES